MDKDSLIEQYKILHKRKKYGISSIKLLNLINEIIDFKPISILDYGCGQSILIDKLDVSKKYKYDPSILGIDKLPITKVDLVLCNDVLEHVLEEDIDNLLKELKSLSNKVIFSIGIKLAVHKLPNGQNPHVTIKSVDWWLNKIKNIFGKVVFVKDIRSVKFLCKTW